MTARSRQGPVAAIVGRGAENTFVVGAVIAVALVAAVTTIGLLATHKMAAVALLLVPGFVALLWASGNPRLVGLWGLLLTAPLSLSKKFVPVPHMGGAGSYNIDACDVFLLLLTLFLARDILARRRRLRLSGVAIAWSGLILLGFVSVAIGPMRQVALQQCVEMAKEMWLFLVLLNELVRVRQFLQAFAAVAAGVALEALLGIAQFIKKGDIGLQKLGEATLQTLEYANLATYTGDASTFRIGGLFGHPNLLAGFFVIVTPIVLAMLMTRQPPLRRMLLAGTLLLALVALLLTLSRSGWMAFAIAALVVIGLMLWNPMSRRTAAPVALTLVVGAVLGAGAAAPSIIRRLTESDSGAIDFRWEWMSVAWRIVLEHPVLGIGLNSFVYNLPGRTQYGDDVDLTLKFGEVWPVVHDIYLLIWAEQGTLGFACFVAMLLVLLRTGWRNAWRVTDPQLHAMSLGCLAGVCANIVDGFGSFFLRNPACARIFWIVAAIMVAIGYWHRANAPGGAGTKAGAGGQGR